jgi:Tfp pilus assembly protein PilV
MTRPQEGFLLIEVLVSFVLVTSFVIICMRYRAQSLTLQAHALSTIDVVNQLELMLDTFNRERRIENIANSQFRPEHSLKPVTWPTMRGNPPNLSLEVAGRMKVVTMSLVRAGASGPQVYSLPLIFKGTHENY